MVGIDQIFVALWLLPVVLFIVLPLCITCLWGLVSCLKVFQPLAGQKQQYSVVIAKD